MDEKPGEQTNFHKTDDPVIRHEMRQDIKGFSFVVK
ncbi:MAG: hypothetical protein JWN78_1936 [Bacteroidota bacterium]|nr:hypothetical protein [Bacteroidota bacterium]